MKKKRKRPTWRAISTRAYHIARQDDEARANALAGAVNASPLKAPAEDLDKFLGLAEPWVDRDILRAHLLAEGELPADTWYVLAFIRERESLIGPSQWSIMPPSQVGTRPARVFAIGTPGEIYALGLEHGGIVIGLWAEWTRLHLGRADLDYGDAAQWIRERMPRQGEQ